MQLKIVRNALVICSSCDVGIKTRQSEEMDVRDAVQYVHRMVNA